MTTSPLTTWTYTQEEWNEFVQIETSHKKEDSIYLGIGIVILGTIGLMFFRGTSFLTGLLFTIPIAILIPVLRMKFSYKHLKKGIESPTVTFFYHHIKVNYHTIELTSSKKRVKSVKIIDIQSNGRQLLEFDVQWMTGKGPTNDEFRFLIPEGKYEEARKMISNYQQSTSVI
jgi:hypothetical protein